MNILSLKILRLTTLIFVFTITLISCGNQKNESPQPDIFVKFILNYVEAGISEKIVGENGKVNFSDPERTGFVFEGWFENKEGEGSRVVLEDKIFNDNTTLFAKWREVVVEPNPNSSAIPLVKITLDLNFKGTDEADSKVLEKQTNEQGKLEYLPKRERYTFAGWYDNAELRGDAILLEEKVFKKEAKFYGRWQISTKEDLIYEIKRAVQQNGFEVNLNYIDTGLITDMSFLFSEKGSIDGVIEIGYWEEPKFNGKINKWDVSNVRDMSGMFYNNISFSQSLEEWDVSNVIDMSAMFSNADSFNQPLNDWNVSNVENINNMFGYADKFNQSLNDWDVSSVKYMNGVFEATEKFNQPLNKWNVSNVKAMDRMFASTNSFNQPLAEWDVSQVTDMYGMYLFAQSFNQDLNEWNVSSDSEMSDIFKSSGMTNFPSWCTNCN